MIEKNRPKKINKEDLWTLDSYIKFFRELYSNIYEFFKLSQDYLKVLVPLNTATILILIAFLDRIFSSSKFKYMLLISFICFGISLLSALRTMIIISDFYTLVSSSHVLAFVLIATGAVDLEKRKNDIAIIKKAAEKTAKKQKFWYALANYSYFFGFIILIIFVVINLLFK